MPPSLASVIHLARTAAGVVRVAATNREGRRGLIMRARRPRGMFQPYCTTSFNRHPELFGLLATLLSGRPVNVLSFGCSTGDEAFTLRAYLPQATVRGLDISSANIRDARRKLRRSPDPKLSFAVAADTTAEPTGRYDAVVCLSVFRHGDLGDSPPSSEPLLRFTDFELAVTDISRCLKSGGLLALAHSNFRVMDTRAAPLFQPLTDTQRFGRGLPSTPKYDATNRLSADQSPEVWVYRKL